MAKREEVSGNKANANSGSKTKDNELARGLKQENGRKEMRQIKIRSEIEIDRFRCNFSDTLELLSHSH